MGLDETVYGTARSNILAQDPLPNMNKGYSIFIQEERVKTMTREKDTYGISYATEVKDKTMSCTNCHKRGDDVETCFEIHGYPEWWGDRPRVDRSKLKTMGNATPNVEEPIRRSKPLPTVRFYQRQKKTSGLARSEDRTLELCNLAMINRIITVYTSNSNFPHLPFPFKY
ncbi:hypothetical protein Tco_1243165 [Tanacetum coccineum]